MKKEFLKKEFFMKKDAITLIALVITIIVLLILAGVSIATLAGDGGILSKATKAKTENTQGTIEEEIKLAYNAIQMDSIMNGWDLNKKAEELEKELRKQDEETEVEVLQENIMINYKKYDITIYEDNTISVEETEGKPIGIAKVITEGNALEKVEIKVIAIATEGEIKSIEAITEGATEVPGDSSEEKTFEVTKNGKYYFIIKGTNEKKQL